MIAELISRGINRLSGTANPDSWLINWANGGQATASGEYINEENALNCPAVKAAVSVLSESMATLSLEVYRVNKSGSKEVAPDHPIQQLLSREANPDTSDVTWRDTLQNHLGTYGNAYAFINRAISGTPVALWQRSPKPERTRPMRDRETGRIVYEVHDEHGGREGPIPARDMLHIPYFSMDGILGKSPVRMVREAIGGNKAAERFANELFKNGDAANGYFIHPGKLSEGAYARLKASLASSADHGERHRKQILEEGMKFEGTSYNLEQMQMTAVRMFLLREIARAYRITPHLLQDLEGASFSNVTELGRQFVIYTLLPWCMRWTAEINRKLLLPPYYVRFNFSPFLTADPAARSARQRTLFSIGALSVNDILHEEGLNPLTTPNADEHFVPLNMVPLSRAGEMGMKPNPEGGDPTNPIPGAVPGGDGIQPAMPGGQEGGRPEKQSPAARGQLALLDAEALVAETLHRLERIEANEALRAAKDPRTFTARIDAFYAKHTDTLREALYLPVRVVVSIRDDLPGCLSPLDAVANLELDTTVDEHVAGHRAALLSAAECKGSELPARVAACVADWGK